MAKTVYIYFAWQDHYQTLTLDDKQTVRKALRAILPAGVRSDEIESAIDETGLNVIDQFGEFLHEGMKITVSRNKLYEGGASGVFAITIRRSVTVCTFGVACLRGVSATRP